jgi:hypothetical protein
MIRTFYVITEVFSADDNDDSHAMYLIYLFLTYLTAQSIAQII